VAVDRPNILWFCADQHYGWRFYFFAKTCDNRDRARLEQTGRYWHHDASQTDRNAKATTACESSRLMI